MVIGDQGQNQDYVRVRLHNISTEAKCGVHPWERHSERPNRLRIDVDLYARLGRGGSLLDEIIDYDPIRNFIKSFPNRPHTDLLETLVNEIIEQCFNIKRVESCRVSILKLDIFNEIEGVGVENYRTRDSWESRT
jgi:7,8-dihydroneopterin aldolase/epimerase/oxygenase